ncbi:hypothetical protein niasHT_008613 [Heterodera trifolii]|uniref:Uncharacterized protein n=1 Tax=Heterodera trifolii TaxID=157864 RepID=A0ABD2LW30_9BILA
MAHSARSNRMSARRRRASSSSNSSSAARRTMPTSTVHRRPRAAQSSRSCATPRRCPRTMARAGRPAGPTATNSNRANTRAGTRRTAEAAAHSDHPADDGHGPAVAKRAKTDSRSTRVLPVNSSRRREHEQRRRSPSVIMLPAAPLDSNNGTSSQTLGKRVSLDDAITRLAEAEEKRWTRVVRDTILPTASRIDKAFGAFENAIGGLRRAVTDVLTGTFDFVQKTSEQHIIALRCIQQQIEDQQKQLDSENANDSIAGNGSDGGKSDDN